MRRLLAIGGALALIVATALWVLSGPKVLDEADYSNLQGDASRGEQVFWASGCASCHADPEATGEAKLILSGGYRIESPFGTFIAPNISPSAAGIAAWSTYDLANALIAGVSVTGQHLYPSLPYTTYIKMAPQDVADLKAYMDGLPMSETPSLPHEVGFPFNIRRGLGLWKQLNLRSDWVVTDVPTPQLERGRYLVEALGHCAECHTPRNAIGALDTSRWMQGAPNPSGKGSIPPISPDELTWSVEDIAYYLESGFTPEFDSAGGAMAKVVEATAKLSAGDREAIAAYLKLPVTGR